MGFIYVLCDPITGELRYVGKTIQTLEKRLNHHVSDVRELNHRSNWILSLRMDGLKPTIHSIEEVSDDRLLDEREIFWIAHYRALGCNLLNACDGGGGTLHPTDETRLRMRLSHLGKKPSPESLVKKSAAMKGKPQSDAKRAKISAAMQGNKHNLGHKRSEETRAKMSAAQKGKPRRPHTAEWRANMSVRMMGNKHGVGHTSRTGQKLSAESRARISLALKGNKYHLGHAHSPETRAKMVAAWQKRKEREMEAAQ